MNSAGCNGSFIYYYCSFPSVLILLHSSGLSHAISFITFIFPSSLPSCMSFISPPFISPSPLPSICFISHCFAVGDRRPAPRDQTTKTHRHDATHTLAQTHTRSQLITDLSDTIPLTPHYLLPPLTHTNRSQQG